MDVVENHWLKQHTDHAENLHVENPRKSWSVTVYNIWRHNYDAVQLRPVKKLIIAKSYDPVKLFMPIKVEDL